jgi:hypothetical protein
MPIYDRIISEHIVHFDMVKLRNQRNRVRAGKQIRALTKYASQMTKKGYKIEHIKPKERGYTGKGLFYGIRIRLDNI